MQRGFRHFGFCGDCRFAWARDYSRHFVAALQRAGHACDVFDSQPGDALNWNRERRKLARWIAALPKPGQVEFINGGPPCQVPRADR